MTVFTPAMRRLAAAVLCAMSLAACQKAGDESAGESAAAGRTDSAGGMSGMSGMGGMGGMMNMGAMDSMSMRMDMMDTVSADRMRDMVPMHRQMAANMLSQMSADMRTMNMAATPAWSANLDSLRQDLVRMAEMSGAEVKTMMPAHRGRMMRLMQMHREMMERMK